MRTAPAHLTRRRAAPLVLSALVAVAALITSSAVQPAAAALPPPPTTEECQSATGFACYGVDQIRTAYDMNRLLAHGLDGRGQRIGIYTAAFAPRHDLDAFDTGYGLPAADLHIVSPLGPISQDPPTEPFASFLNLDFTSELEWLHVMAPGATIVAIEAPCGELSDLADFQCLDQTMSWMLDRNLVDVIVDPGGDGEAALGPDVVLGTRGWIVQAARQHVPVISVAGDVGRLNDINPGLGPDPWWPAIDPLVTDVGTTELTLDSAGHRTAPDRVWNDSARVLLPLAGGGGVSKFFARPGYQHDQREIIGTHRGGPDVAMAGGCDGRLVSYTSFDVTDFYVSQQIEPAGWQPFCSSSVSAAMFGGLIAIAQQAAGHHLGPLNPRLYQASDAFLDVTVGNNAVPAGDFLGNPADPGNAAGPGWDLVSGLGSPDAYRLVMELSR